MKHAMIALLSLFLFAQSASALVVEGTAAASSTTFDDSEIAQTAGLSARIRFRHYGSQDAASGIFYGADFPGISPIAGVFMAGYGISTKGPWAWELGGGLFMSPVFGSGIVLLAGPSREITSNLSISIPLIYRTNFYLQATPTLAWRF